MEAILNSKIYIWNILKHYTSLTKTRGSLLGPETQRRICILSFDMTWKSNNWKKRNSFFYYNNVWKIYMTDATTEIIWYQPPEHVDEQDWFTCYFHKRYIDLHIVFFQYNRLLSIEYLKLRSLNFLLYSENIQNIKLKNSKDVLS